MFSGYLGKTFYFPTNEERTISWIFSFPMVLLKIISNEVGTVEVIHHLLEINTTYLITPTVINTIAITPSGMKADSIGIGNKGIMIISTVDVAIYAFKGDADQHEVNVMQLMPVISSAKVFLVQSYETESSRKSHFIIIATEDSTDVNITLKTTSPGNMTYRNITFKDGDVVNITLNQLQTFHAYLSANDLSGSLIESNKPIAVFSGAECVKIPKSAGSCSYIYSQMTPVSQWGYEYIVPPIYPGQFHVRIFALHNDTQISVKAKFDLDSIITLNRGEFWETNLNGSQAQPLVISSDTAISVVLYGASIGSSDGYKSNPFMLVVPDINQYSTFASAFPTLRYRYSHRTDYTFENYAAIVLLEASFNQLQYNGLMPEVLKNYSVLNKYTVVITPLANVTTHTISTAKMSTPVPMAVFVYGMAVHQTYGFVAGFKFNSAGNKTMLAKCK